MANAIRWGTMYNFRFDADMPPQERFATIGLFKLPSAVNVLSIGPQAIPVVTPTVSTWGIVVLTLAVMAAGVVVLRRRAAAD